MNKAQVLREAGEAAIRNPSAATDIMEFAVKTVQDIMMFTEGSDQAHATSPDYPTSCLCGDAAGIAGMCDDCFNVGCSVGKPCFWTDETHEEE